MFANSVKVVCLFMQLVCSGALVSSDAVGVGHFVLIVNNLIDFLLIASENSWKIFLKIQ